MSQTPYVKLPINFQNKEVAQAAEFLKSKRSVLFVKRAFDIIASAILLILLSWLLLILALLVGLTSQGGVFYRQERIGKNGVPFYILKFRSMVANADKIGTAVTVDHDSRITKVGKFLRKTRMDEFPQLLNVLKGDMSFVGPRPEVRKYVEAYTEQDMITLLVRPGISCASSLAFANEANILKDAENADQTYIQKILPEKCKMNIQYVKALSVKNDCIILINTALGRF